MENNNEDKNLNNQNGNPQPPTSTPPSGGGEQQPSWQEVAGVDAKEFDKPEKLATSYKEARTELSKQGETIKEMTKFRETAEPVLKFLFNHPKLWTEFQTEFKKSQGQAPENTSDPKGNIPPTSDPVVKGQVAGLVLRQFESKHGLHQLPDDKRAEVQSALGKIASNINPNWINDLENLEKNMESAWTVYEAQQIKKELGDKAPAIIGGPSGFGTPRNTPGDGNGSGASSLTPEMLRAAEKMGLTAEQYAKELAAIKNNQ